jgi:hypothetical protein
MNLCSRSVASLGFSGVNGRKAPTCQLTQDSTRSGGAVPAPVHGVQSRRRVALTSALTSSNPEGATSDMEQGVFTLEHTIMSTRSTRFISPSAVNQADRAVKNYLDAITLSLGLQPVSWNRSTIFPTMCVCPQPDDVLVTGAARRASCAWGFARALRTSRCRWAAR